MNGYDFDETILKGNSVRRFFCYCFLRLPYLFIYLPVLLAAVIFKRVLSPNAYYNMLTYYVKLVPNKQKFVTKFWDKNIKRIAARGRYNNIRFAVVPCGRSLPPYKRTLHCNAGRP